jgi:histidinol-phosphate phosphatase family domain/HAD-superfamily hydrolase, subfamily IIIA
MSVRAMFLDRDGVVNVDTGYVFRRADFRFIDGIFELCRAATAKGYLVIIVTNQSGIVRGYFTEDDYRTLTAWMLDRFAAEGVRIADVFHCPSLSGPNRKPNPGMFLATQRKHGIDMAASVSLGDRMRDVEAGQLAGVGTNVLFLAKDMNTDTNRNMATDVGKNDGNRDTDEYGRPDHVINSLREMEAFL